MNMSRAATRRFKAIELAANKEGKPLTPDVKIGWKQYLLDLSPYIQYKLITGIDIDYYFKTSGDAVEKLKYVIEVVSEKANQVCIDENKESQYRQIENPKIDIYYALLCKLQDLLADLIRVRGTHIFMESEHLDNYVVRVCPKDPKNMS